MAALGCNGDDGAASVTSDAGALETAAQTGTHHSGSQATSSAGDGDTTTSPAVATTSGGDDETSESGEAPTELDTPSEDNPIGYCAEAVAVGDDPLIDDFEDGDLITRLVDNRRGRWFTFDDATPEGQVGLQVHGSDAGGNALHITSTGFARWGSGVGVTLRYTVTGEEVCYYDASHYAGIRFLAKGQGALRLAVAEPATTPVEAGGSCTPAAVCNDTHGVDVPLTEDWSEHRFEFEQLRQLGWGASAGDADPTQLFAIHFQMGASQEANIWLDDLGFFVHDETEDAGAGADAGGRTADGDASSAATTAPVDASSPAPGDASSPAASDASFDSGTR